MIKKVDYQNKQGCGRKLRKAI